MASKLAALSAIDVVASCTGLTCDAPMDRYDTHKPREPIGVSSRVSRRSTSMPSTDAYPRLALAAACRSHHQAMS
jgi:hypothetical protein